MLGVCEHDHIVFIPWGPLAQRAQASTSPDARNWLRCRRSRPDDCPGPTATLAWLLAKSPVMLPIPGTSRTDHLLENIAAAKVRFTHGEMTRIG